MLRARNVGLYYFVFAAVVLSTAVLVFGFERQLRVTTEQTVKAFRADNAPALAAGNLPMLTSRLNALMSSVNWVCITVSQGNISFFEQRRGECGNSFFRRQIQLADGSQSDVRVVLTLRMPPTLELSFLAELCFHLLCLGVIFWGTKQAETERHLEEARRAVLLTELASQVAHDIRSPLAALDVAAHDLFPLPEDKRILIRSAISRIRDIANDLLDRPQGESTSHEMVSSHHERTSPQPLSSLLDSVVSEKRLQFRSRSSVEIELRLDASSYGLFAAVKPTEFKRIISNLVDNSVEAFGSGHGSVIVGLRSGSNRALVAVQDDGKGIPPEILTKLGRRGETYGKAGGSGLGLYHARSSAESWGGTLNLTSAINTGTAVTILLPLAPAPSWFVPEILLNPDRAIVILDDDASIHQVWQSRLDALKAAEKGVRIIHASTPDDLRAWFKSSNPKEREALYLLDYELLGHRETGLSLADELGLGEQGVLVTSRYEEPEVLIGCSRLKMRLIPKGLAGLVPMRVVAAVPARARLDAVLIDDDALARMTWKMAAVHAGKKFETFAKMKDFLDRADTIARDTPIYVDGELSNGVNGALESLRIHALGFHEIYLATGHEATKFSSFTHLHGVVGKAPPWDTPGAS